MANTNSTLLRLRDNSSRIYGDKNTPDALNRYAGGSRKITPYISGYWYVAFELPAVLFNDTEKTLTWLTSAAEGFTPHSRTVTKVDLPGMGGMGSSFASGQQVNRQFSITFGEYQNLPIYNTMRLWTSMFDEQEGVSLITLNSKAYKGVAHVFLAKPQITNENALQESDIEEYYGYDGVWPETSPTDTFASDIATNDRATPAVQFNFDGNPLTSSDVDVNNILGKLTPNKVDSFATTKTRVISGSTTASTDAPTGQTI